jgi:hypothetical protein
MVQAEQVKLVSPATIVSVIVSPTPRESVLPVTDVVVAGELASIVCAEDSTRVVCAEFELPAASVSVTESVVAPAARSSFPSTTV